jgi:hypothetical protein
MANQFQIRLLRHGLKVCTLILIQSVLIVTTPNPSIADESKSYSLQDIDNITILPLVLPERQAAEDREEKLSSLYGELDEYTYKALLRKLALKGYVLSKPRRWSIPDNWSVERLKSLSPEELAALAPQNASYVAFLFLDRIESTNHVVHSSADALVSAMILHRPSGSIVWEKSSEGHYSEHLLQIFSPFGNPLGMLISPDKHAAVENAFKSLFEDFPERVSR